MSPPWMPLYVGDYLADTGHLTTLEHGAYLLLIMTYWRKGGLPDDDAQLARIARMSAEEWSNVRSTIVQLFGNGWKHKRIEAELSRSAEKSNKARDAGKKSGQARNETEIKASSEPTLNGRSANVPTDGELSQSQSQDKAPNGALVTNLTVGSPKASKKGIRTKIAYPEMFNTFWMAYPTDANMSKKEALREWEKLEPDDQALALSSVPAYKAWCSAQKDYRTLHACRYLSQRRFEGHAQTAVRVNSQIFVKIGGAQWRAWESWHLGEHGKKPPVNKEGTGWWFQSEWPPGHLAGAS